MEGRLSRARSREALGSYPDLPLERHGHLPLLPRILDMADNFSAYDATYVVLAESLEATLVTADTHLARAARSHTRLALIEAGPTASHG